MIYDATDWPSLNYSDWTEEQLAKLPFLELLVLSFDGEASLHPGGRQSTERLFSILEPASDDYVLEVGCGSGRDLCSLVERYGCRAAGIDSSDLMVKFAKRTVEEAGLASKVNIFKDNIGGLSFKDNEFDAVIAQSVLATVIDKDKAATEILRVLKPNRRFGDIELTWIDKPDEDLIKRVEQRIGSFDRPLRLDQWIDLFKKVGFRETNIIFTSDDFGFPTDMLGMIKHNGFAQSMKLFRLVASRGNKINFAKRTEHIRWMKDSGKIGYGICLFEKN